MKQTPIESRSVSELLDEISTIYIIKPEAAALLAEEIIRQSEASRDSRTLGIGYYYRGRSAYARNDQHACFSDISAAIPLLQSAEEWLYLIRCQGLLGILYEMRGHLLSAMDSYLQALDCADQHGYFAIRSATEVNLSSLYLICGLPDVAYAHLRTAEECISKEEDAAKVSRHLLYIRTNLIQCSIIQRRYREAESALHEILAAPQLRDDGVLIQYAYILEAILYRQTDRLEECRRSVQSLVADFDRGNIYLHCFNEYRILCHDLLEGGMQEEVRVILDYLQTLINKSDNTFINMRYYGLRMEYDTVYAPEAEYTTDALAYARWSQKQELENRQFVTDVLVIRNRLRQVELAHERSVRKERELSARAEHDPLTGLLNRYALELRAEELRNSETPVGFLLLDVDHFKVVNDTYGHEIGDRILVKLSKLLQHTFRSSDYPIRMGGDEFAVLLPSCCCPLSLIENKIAAMNHTLLHPDDGLPPVSISAGAAFSSRGYEDQLYTEADRALYSTKDHGRCGFTCCSSPENPSKP